MEKIIKHGRLIQKEKSGSRHAEMRLNSQKTGMEKEAYFGNTNFVSIPAQYSLFCKTNSSFDRFSILFKRSLLYLKYIFMIMT